MSTEKDAEIVRLTAALEEARGGERLWHKRTIELQASMQRMIHDAPENCREWIYQRVCETWDRLNALSGEGKGECNCAGSAEEPQCNCPEKWEDPLPDPPAEDSGKGKVKP